MSDTITINHLGEEVKIKFVKGTYVQSGNLYVAALSYDNENQRWELFSDVTVNLCQVRAGEAFIDVKNCPEEIIHTLVTEKLVTPLSIRRSNGFCVYPLYIFSNKFLDKMETIQSIKL